MVLKIIFDLLELIQPILVPLCFVLAWIFIWLLLRNILSTVNALVARAKQMHRIPCTHCQFFVDDHRLKCTVQPYVANTEQAINCSDYHPKA